MGRMKKSGKIAAVGNTAGGQYIGITADRRYKDTVFRMLFKEKKELLELYNAVSGRR